MPTTIGIDLGTTNSCVAYVKSDTVMEVVENHFGNKTTPSVVHFGSMFKEVGEAAQAKRGADPRNTVFQVKRLMGRSANDAAIENRPYPFKILPTETGDACIGVSPTDKGGTGESKTYRPEHVSSLILRYMMVLAQQKIGSEVKDAVITVPANFTNAQREATKHAGEMAGLNVLRIINEPTAAALAYGFNLKSEKERIVLVYDLGGGTFDVSIVRARGLKAEVLSTAGESFLGGEDFDRRILKHATAEFEKQGIHVHSDEFGLLRSCEEAKITLSTIDRTTVETYNNGKRYACEITRKKFEELCMDLFKKTIDCVKDAIAEAKIDKKSIDDVVLVGGSSRIPKVKQMVREFFGNKELKFNIPPDHAVACGAAILAESLSTNPDQECSSIRGEVKLADVLPFSLGTQITYGRFSVLLRRNTKYPTSYTSIYYNAEANTTELACMIFEGENTDVMENTLLGECRIPVPKRSILENKIHVTYSVDANGILSVHLRDEETAEEASTKVRTSRLTDEQRFAMVRNARLEEEHEKKERAKYLALTSFADAMGRVKLSVEKSSSAEKKAELKKLIQEEDHWIQTESPSNEDLIKRASTIREKHRNIIKP